MAIKIILFLNGSHKTLVVNGNLKISVFSVTHWPKSLYKNAAVQRTAEFYTSFGNHQKFMSA